jgi:hypothetical protein
MLCSIGGVERGPRRRELAATAISCLPSRQSAIVHEPPYRPAMMALGWGFYRYSANVLPVRRRPGTEARAFISRDVGLSAFPSRYMVVYLL